MPFYDDNEGEFIDFATMDDWRERDQAKDAKVEALTRERDEALAQVAAAYTAGYDRGTSAGRMIEISRAEGDWAIEIPDEYLPEYPADAKAALDKLLRHARAEAMREAAQICIDLRQGWPAPDILARATEIEEGLE